MMRRFVLAAAAAALFAAAAAPVAAAADPCLDVIYADQHYGDCCGSGNWKQEGHQVVCHELQKERREEGDAKNIDYHKEPPDSKVLVVEGDLFWERIAKRHDVMLVMFYAPWCGYCKKYSPDFRKAANELHHCASAICCCET
jgi:thiol-disulfide isomerase/thioredoxin